MLLSLLFYSRVRYLVDFDLKKGYDVSEANRVESRKALKKLFEEKYKTQTGKDEKKTGGVQYLFKKLRF